MTIKCPSCKRKIADKQYHKGFSGLGILYCEKKSATLKFNTYNPNYVKLVGDKHPWSLNTEEKHKVEQHISPLPSGDRFLFDAHPICPYCNFNLQSVLEDEMHYIEVGYVIDADIEDVWI